MRGLDSVIAAGLCSALCGCSTLPSFDNAVGPSHAAPTVSEIVTHIQCEMKNALEDNDAQLDGLRKNYYVVYANLTLDVTDNQGLAPTLSFIRPYAATGTNLTGSVSGQFTGEQHRNINQTFTLDLDQTKINPAKAGDCLKDREGLFGIKGDLGIKEVIIAGLQHASSADFIFPVPVPTDDHDQALQLSTSLVPNFGSTIDFTIVYGLGGGPNWTLTHFTGPSGSSGLLSLTRTNKETLVLSFASAGPNPRVNARAVRQRGPNGFSDIEQAGVVAQDNATRMILQRILSVH